MFTLLRKRWSLPTWGLASLLAAAVAVSFVAGANQHRKLRWPFDAGTLAAFTAVTRVAGADARRAAEDRAATIREKELAEAAAYYKAVEDRRARVAAEEAGRVAEEAIDKAAAARRAEEDRKAQAAVENAALLAVIQQGGNIIYFRHATRDQAPTLTAFDYMDILTGEDLELACLNSVGTRRRSDNTRAACLSAPTEARDNERS